MPKNMDEIVLEKYERLIYKVLSDSRILLFNPSYEDWAQELRMCLVQLSTTAVTLDEFESCYPLAYLYRKLKWALVDLRRKEQREGHELIDPAEWSMQIKSEITNNEDTKLLIEAFYQQLGIADQEKLRALVEDQPLSRQLRAYYRKTLRKKFNEFR